MKAASERRESEFFCIFESSSSINTRPHMAEWVPASPQRTLQENGAEKRCGSPNGMKALLVCFPKRVRQTAGGAH